MHPLSKEDPGYSLGSKARKVAQTGMMLGLAGMAIAVAAPASAATVGNVVHNCYGIYFTTDWNQECGSTGARAYGYYKTTADCTAPQIPDKSGGWNRAIGNRTSYDGADCAYGIHSASTWFQ
jgi:hypothetical protein